MDAYSKGAGLGLLFIPITTLALSTLKGQQIGQGAAFTGMMRQLGGSFGVACITTFIANRSMMYRGDMVSMLNVNDAAVQQRVDLLKNSFLSKGFSIAGAQQSAYKVLDGMVTKQSAILAYMDVFLYLGFALLVCIPFILLVRQKKDKQ